MIIKKNIAYSCASAVILNLFCGCLLFLNAAPPAWISGSDRRWPSERYLTGIGAAGSIGAAQDKARAEIAKVFKVAIEQITIEKSAEATTGTDGNTTTSSVDLEQNTTALVSDSIEGIEIAQVWYDKKEKLYWALAVLDRQKYASVISGRIMDAESKISSSIQAARNTDTILSNLERLKYLSSALESMDLRDELALRLRAIGIPPVAPPAAIGEMAVSPSAGIESATRKEIADEISSIKQSTVFKILVNSSADDAAFTDESQVQLKQMLKERLMNLGFNVLSEGEIVDISPSVNISHPTVEARVSVSPFVRQGIDNSKDYWKYARWEGYFEVKDMGRVLVAAGASGSESNPDESVALKKAQLSCLKVMGDLFERKFRQEFGGSSRQANRR